MGGIGIGGNKKDAAGKLGDDFLDDASNIVGARGKAVEYDEIKKGGAGLILFGKGFPEGDELRLNPRGIDDLLTRDVGHGILQALPSFPIISSADLGPQLPDA